MSPLHIVALSLPLDTYIQGIAVYIYRADWTWSRSYSCSWSCAFERVTFIAVWLCSQEKPKPERNCSRSRRRRGSRRRRRRRRQRWLLGIVIFLMIYSARFFSRYFFRALMVVVKPQWAKFRALILKNEISFYEFHVFPHCFPFSLSLSLSLPSFFLASLCLYRLPSRPFCGWNKRRRLYSVSVSALVLFFRP